MSSPWSSQYTVSENHDLQVDSMALDVDGDFIVLAGTRHVALMRLTDSADILFKIPRNHKYHMTAVEWSPTEICKELCAITTNERVEILTVREADICTSNVLKHHTRQVTDLSWHRFEPYQLTTASTDSSTLVWDIRDARRPTLTLLAISCVNHVRCSKLSSNLIATAHDGDLRIWDERKGSTPIQYITAHTQKIHGIDWSEMNEFQLASCSQDCSVKIFDVTKPKRPESTMLTAAPLWRARYTPWGEGLVTAVIPSASGESSLQMWNVSNPSGAVHTFGGSLDVVLELQWKRKGDEFQLVTLSRDQGLRTWRIEPSLRRLCSYTNEGRTDSVSDVPINDISDVEIAVMPPTETGLPALEILGSTFEEISSNQADLTSSQSIQDEVDLLSIPAVSVQTVDPTNRSLLATVIVNSHKLTLLINFPPSYPYNAAPSFEIEEPSSMDSLLKNKILKVLKQTAQQRVRRNLTCLESCLYQLVSTLELTAQVEERIPARVSLGTSPARVADAASVYSSFHDAYIPYPRSSGARFCSVGTLVSFCRPVRVNPRPDSFTPRSLSAATTLSFGGSYGGSYSRYPVPGSSQDASGPDLGFFLPDRQMLNRALSRGSRVTKLSRTVSVCDVSKLFFVHRELAEKYQLDLQDVPGTCSKNALVAASVGRQDLVQVWTLAALAAATDVENGMPWNDHPFSTAQIDHMIQHYAKISDIQTAAMLSCMFPETNSTKSSDLPKSISSTLKSPGRRLPKGSSPYHTIHPTDTSLNGWQIPVLKKNRSNSWSEPAEEISIVEHQDILLEIRKRLTWKNPLREELKRRYSDMLHMWGLLDARTQVLKMLDEPVSHLTAREFRVACSICHADHIMTGNRSTLCHHIALRCSFCHVLVKGASIVCMACSHGGHAAHMMAWFEAESDCPTGCGCRCSSETNQAIET